MNFEQAKARCRELGITPARSLAGCMERIAEAEGTASNEVDVTGFVETAKPKPVREGRFRRALMESTGYARLLPALRLGARLDAFTAGRLYG